MAKYIGLLFPQSEGGPVLLTFVAPAEDVRSWAGIPYKRSHFLGGFQRPLSNRYEKIIDFFDREQNVSPTSIVVAFRPGATQITDLPIDESLGVSQVPRLVLLEVEKPELSGKTLTQLAAMAAQQLAGRIAEDKLPAGAEGDDEDAEHPTEAEDAAEAKEAEETADADVPEEGADSTSDWGVDVGKSELRRFCESISTPERLSLLVDEIAVELARAEKGSELAPTVEAQEIEDQRDSARSKLRDVLEAVLLPGTIVDGQHRVWGAAESTRDVPFAVCALIDAGWEEQVFQFVVINKQARAISGELLASIVNSSLTNHEIQALEARLDTAGISTFETRMLRYLNDDPDSPFVGFIARGLDEASKKITFKAAIALASRWSKKMNDRDGVYKTLFRPGLQGATNADKAQDWEDRWKDYMFAFWSAIKKLYEGDHLWEPGTQLMYRATLQVLQDNFLTIKAISGETFKDPIELREKVQEFYGGVPGGFFHTPWKRKELLTEDGQKVLKDAINAMRVPGAKLKSVQANQPLFTGASTSLRRSVAAPNKAK